MLAVKRVKLPASGWLNRQDKPLTRRGMFPVEICEIHSLGRYSREVLIGCLRLSHPRNGHAEKGELCGRRAIINSEFFSIGDFCSGDRATCFVSRIIDSA